MAKADKFWNKLAKRYAATPIKDVASYEKKLDKSREYFRPDMEVFEFGCGTGSTAIAHSQYVRHIHATDLAENMIAIAKEKAEAAGITNITFETASIDEVNKPDDSVDVVMGNSILHLLPNMEEVVYKAFRMLKPGGVFVSSSGCIGDAGLHIKIMVYFMLLIRVAPPLNIFTQQELEDAITGGGFNIEHVWRPGKNAAVFIIARKPAG